MIRAALFDLDGTLVSSLPELARGVAVLSERRGMPVPPEEAVAAMIGGGARVLAERLIRWWAERAAVRAMPETDGVLHELVDIWAAMDGSLVSEIPGAFSGVRALRDAGIAVWLVTNKERALTLTFLASRGLESLFDGVVAAGDCPRVKPAPDMILAALSRAGAQPAEAVMVGDSCNDALAARAAGVRALLVESGYNEGIPLSVWAKENGFAEVFPSVKEVCAALLEENGKKA